MSLSLILNISFLKLNVNFSSCIFMSYKVSSKTSFILFSSIGFIKKFVGFN